MFPEDKLLAEMGANGYAATPLRDSGGEAIGLMGIITTKPLGNQQLVESVLQIVATRAAQEIEAVRRINQLELKNFTIENIRDAVYWISPEGRFDYVNHAAMLMLGYSREQFLSMSVADIDPLFPAERWAKYWVTIKEQGNSKLESIHRSKDGYEIPVEITVTHFTFNECEYLCALVRDISERKLLDETQMFMLKSASLHPKNNFFESLARYLAKCLNMDYVCIDRLFGDGQTARTVAIYFDGEFEDNVEYSLKDTPCGDVVGKEVCVFPSGVRHQFANDVILQEMVAESYIGTTLWSYDEKPIGLIAVIGRKPLENSHVAESVLKLVAVRAAGELERKQPEEERIQIEQQFQQAQKLESLGILAGGIAHDFNNILAIIMGNCSLAKMDSENAKSYIPEIEKASDRAAELCRQMLAYAGKAHIIETQFNIWMLVDEMVNMLKASIAQNVTIIPELATNIPSVDGDASQIRQVVMNLIINAAEAIGEAQGEIRVFLTKAVIAAEGAEKDHQGKAIPPGLYVCLEITDNGCGMDEETKWRIFEPFYTTKFTGRGLGMSAVLGIITAHNGALQLFSQQGSGTTFKVYLPVASVTTQDESIQDVPAQQWRGSGTILLVEDEEQIRSLAKILLNKLGFTVIEASNGEEALTKYQNNAAEIVAVLTDMGMPVMDGYTLFRELKSLKPELPIIISSGFGDMSVTSKIASGDIAGMIAKPYSFDKLREVLKRVVDTVA